MFSEYPEYFGTADCLPIPDRANFSSGTVNQYFRKFILRYFALIVINTIAGLRRRNGTDQAVECFELAGRDGIYYPAVAKIHKNRRDCVVVSSEQVPAPVNIRFAFSNYHKVNLYINEGLPAYPFRSDSISY
ncbi:MAG: hypothetical protein ACI3ZQ_09270 [Candidatus Cryptobacteroides sp.]